MVKPTIRFKVFPVSKKDNLHNSSILEDSIKEDSVLEDNKLVPSILDGFKEKNMLAVNIFKKIIERTIPAKIIHEDEQCLAFHDVNPQAPVHILIIPKKEIVTHDEITEGDEQLLGHLHLVAVKIARELQLFDGYRLVLNCKDAGGQSVPHLHLHLLSGRPMSWPPG